MAQIFKKSLSSFEPDFNEQIGPNSLPSWPGVQTIKKSGTPALCSYVSVQPYSIGYAVLGEALERLLPMVRLQRGGIVLTASARAVEYAVMDLGHQFSDPERLTGEIHNAKVCAPFPIPQCPPYG